MGAAASRLLGFRLLLLLAVPALLGGAPRPGPADLDLGGVHLHVVVDQPRRSRIPATAQAHASMRRRIGRDRGIVVEGHAAPLEVGHVAGFRVLLELAAKTVHGVGGGALGRAMRPALLADGGVVATQAAATRAERALERPLLLGRRVLS